MSASFEPLDGLSLQDPGLLALALLAPLALLLRARRGPPALRFAPFPFAVGLPRSLRARLAPAPLALRALGLALLALALARPVRVVELPPASEGIDVFLCLDRSSSMAAADMDLARTRLDVARDAAAAFVAGRPHDRIGLIGFARYADLAAPLTLDHGALAEILARLEPVERDGPEDATAIGAAVARAAQLLAASEAPSKVAILLSDGEENVATALRPEEIAPLHAAQLCADLGVRVYAIAAGAEAGVDLAQVRRLAELSGGEFFEARDADALARVFAAIDELETAPLAAPRRVSEERFLAFLAAAVGFVALGRLLEAALFEVLP